MVVKKSGTTTVAVLDDWRDYFRTSNSNIFDIIEHAIMVAASDCPQEFRLRRDGIAETLFSCKLRRCVGCDRAELSVAGGGGDEIEGGGGGSKGSKVNSSAGVDQVEMNVVMKQVNSNNYSYGGGGGGGEETALTDEIEQESRVSGEVLRIKHILDNNQDESGSVLLDSLRRLQLITLSVDTLKATQIGKSVNALRKHGSKQIRDVARMLIEVWKDIVDEWVNSTSGVAGTEGTPESVNPSVLDEEEGLPSPPLDEGYFFAPQTTSVQQLSQFFDGMDDDGNPQNSGEFNKNRENGRIPSAENENVPKWKQQVPHEPYVPSMSSQGEQMKKQAAILKPHKPSNKESGPERPTTKVNAEQKVRNEAKFDPKPAKATIQKKPPAAHEQDKPKQSDEAARLETAKRKLHERYQQAENAKKQRTIQVMELHDLPKQGLGPRNAPTKPGSHHRHHPNGHR